MIASAARLLATRSPRERLLLALLVLVAMPIAFLGLVAFPLLDAGRTAGQDLAQARAMRDWYRARQHEIAALPVEPVAPQAVVPVGLGGLEAQLVDTELRDAVTLLANAPGGGIALGLAAVDFAQLMRWVEDLPGTTGYAVATLQVTGTEPGLVSGDLRLAPIGGQQ